MFIDTHTHLYLEEFDGDRDAVIARAAGNGVAQMLLPNIDSSTVEKMLQLSRTYPGICLPMIGLHPGSVKPDYLLELERINEWLRKGRFCAIGEVGMDLYWDKTYLKEQIEVFSIQINWADKYRLPLVIHCREAFGEIFDILDKELKPGQTGVFHSFTGSVVEVEKIMEMDFYFGINGIASFKNTDLKTVIAKIPPERLLLETDSPYLAPVPKRGKRNESAFLPYVAEAVASIYGMGLEDLAGITTQNAKNLFKLDQ
jgi:TatD DNase family protein